MDTWYICISFSLAHSWPILLFLAPKPSKFVLFSTVFLHVLAAVKLPEQKHLFHWQFCGSSHTELWKWNLLIILSVMFSIYLKNIKAPFFLSRPDLLEVLAVLLIINFVCSFKLMFGSCYIRGLFKSCLTSV